MIRLLRLPLVFLLLGGLIFVAAQNRLGDVKRARVKAEIEVALPLFMQVVLAGGDRYLAASWAAIRALVTETQKMTPDEFRVLAKVQQDASWLNPAHEDNYYIAAAILPWVGQVDAAQRVLQRAMQARPFDFQPAFSYSFNLLYFKNEAAVAADTLRQAAARLPDPEERVMLEDMAARWLGRSQDLDMAARIVDIMAAQAKRRDFADYLRKRSQRLRDLATLRRAATVYSERHGKRLESLRDLQRSGLVEKIPTDPLGQGFAVDRNGMPIYADGASQ